NVTQAKLDWMQMKLLPNESVVDYCTRYRDAFSNSGEANGPHVAEMFISTLPNSIVRQINDKRIAFDGTRQTMVQIASLEVAIGLATAFAKNSFAQKQTKAVTSTGAATS